MPRCYDRSQIDWPEDDPNFEPPPPKLADFQYLRPPEAGGAKGPVRLPGFAAQAGGSGGSSWLGRWFGRARRSASGEASDAPFREESDARRYGVLMRGLSALGARRLYCRYDGGDDEGFAWLDHVVLEKGGPLDADATAAALVEAGVERLLREERLLETFVKHSAAAQLKDTVDFHLARGWASLVLGQGFGTGELSMFGAFTADLETGLIEDDPDPDAVVRNITIDRSG